MKFKKYSKIRHFIRDKILLPIANKLIGANEKHYVYIERDGMKYKAEYHRTQYWWDSEPITIKGILEKRRTYHVWYWDGDEKGKVWCEMFGWGQSMFYVKFGQDIEKLVSKELNCVIDCWLKYVVNPSKEKKDERTRNADPT